MYSQFVKSFNENGFAILEDLLSESEIDQILSASKNFKNAENGNYRPVMMPHREDKTFMRFMCNEKIVEILKEIVGGEISGLQSELFYGKPGIPGFAAHQDNFFVQANPKYFVSAWTALDDVSPENGGLFVYPGSHKDGLFPVEKLDSQEHASQDPNARTNQTVIPKEFKKQDVVLKRGSTLFIHAHVVHGSYHNSSKNWRHAILNTYIKKGESFRPGKYAQREEITLESF